MFKKTVTFLCVAFFLATLGAPTEAWAASKKKTAGKKKRARPAAARSVAAVPAVQKGRYSAIIIDARTGRILHEAQSTAIRHPASLTKMMTLYIAFQALESGVVRLDSRLPVSALAAGQSPSKLGLKAGQSITVHDAILGLITESANDAAIVLAEGLGGSVEQFAEMMNRQAHALGMNQTEFVNPNGLPDPRQVTTARDMASLGYGLIYHYPGYYPYFSTTSFRYAGRVHTNHNRLMNRYNGMDGIKTGYIRASGFNLVSSAVRGNTRLIGAVFGGTSAVARDNQMARLMDDAFDAAPRAVRTSSVSAQGSALSEGEAYLPLPSKAAVVFGGGRHQIRSASRARTEETAETNVAQNAKNAAQQNEPEQLVGGGAWGVQIGAFSEVGAAQQALATLGQNVSHLLGQAEPSLQKLTMSDGTIVYRARYVGLDQPSARSVCSYLIRRGQGCMVISGI